MSEFTLQAIIDGDSLQLSEVFASIAANEAADPAVLRQQLSAELLSHYVQANPWDARLQSLLDKVIPVALVQIVNDDEFYCSPEHPLRTFFNSITQPASRWCPRDCRPNQLLYDKLSELVAFILYYWSNNTPDQVAPTANMRQHLDNFNSWLATEDKRAAMLEARLCETELANLKLASAETRVTDAINHHLAGRPLPTELHSAITGILKSELQYWAFNTDPAELSQLPLWKSWQRLLPAIGQLFSGDCIAVDDQLLYDQIPLVLAELERSLQHPSSNSQAYAQLVELCNRYLMGAIQKQPMECISFQAIANASGQSDSNTRVPRALLQQTDSIQPGDWIIFDGKATDVGVDNIRCKLVLKNAELDQFLFVDHTGRKVMNKSTKDLALCLSTGIARPLPSQNLDEVIVKQLTALIERGNRSVQAQLLLHKNKAEKVVRAIIAQQQAAAEAAELERAAEQERLQEQLEERRNAARKAMMEARALAHAKMQAEAEQAADAERLRIEQEATQVAEIIAKQQQAAQSISQLQVGAWLEISSELDPDEKLRAKLSVIISSTGKYIFADQFGRKLAEYTRAQLTALLLGEQIKILRNGDNFEDQLAKVIRGLRRDIT